jgi:long-chain fatty acid transport protein
MKLHTRHLLSFGISLLAYGSLDASATRIAFVDAFATARGNAFTATADTPSAVFYNAAGLTQLEGTQVQANVFAISLGYEYDGASGSDSMDDEFQEVPSAFISHKFKDSPIAIGFGMYSPFALGSDWGSDASFTADYPSALSGVPYEAELTYIKHHAVLAWQITETLSVAAGISVDDTEVDIKANALEFEGEDQTTGYSLSVLWQPNQQHSFGLNYQAKTEVTFDGKVDAYSYDPQIGIFQVSMDAKADFVLPESIVFGYSYRPNENWNIEFNLDWTNWDRVNELSLDGVPGGAAYNLNWESSFIWELGATRYLDNGWHVSAGYTFVESSVPDDDFLPIIPDSDRHFFAIGVGRHYENLSWQITYQQAFASDYSVSGNQTSTSIDGDYDLDSQAIACSINFRF